MSSHVCVNKKGLVRHVITPRTLLDAHGPKEVFESKQYSNLANIAVIKKNDYR